jgi:hypothetical protein
MIPARNYTTVSDMLEGYAGIRQRLFAIPKPPIAKIFGKDHTTAIHAFNKIELERARADK